MDIGLTRLKPLALSVAQLPNGLRMVHVHEPLAVSGFFGVMTYAGSRNDPADLFGLAHFVEHVLFKGTKKRTAGRINSRMEAIGGELNAYTTKEETVVYTVFPGDNPERGAELISDLVFNSQFPERELEKEREVVGDEIDSCHDTPSEEVFDVFDELIFGNSSMSHRILGDHATLPHFTTKACRDFLERWYRPDNMCVFYSGAMDADAVFRCVQRHFGSAASGPTVHPADPIVPGSEHRLELTGRHYHQTQTILGALMPASLSGSDRYALALLTNIIGGPGMNSLLNVEMRERRGLVYSVEATTTLLSDCAMTTIYYGCDPDDARRCYRAAERIIRSVADGKIGAKALDRAITQYIGQWIVASENRENTVTGAARAVLIGPGPVARSEAVERIRAITPADIARLAATFADTCYYLSLT